MKTLTGNIAKAILGTFIVWSGLAFTAPLSAQSYDFSNAAFPTGIRPVLVATGDFNGDGIGDVAVPIQGGTDPTCSAGGSISVLLGKRDLTFQSHVDYPLGIDAAFAVVGDLNSDGSPDIAVTNSSSNTVSLLLGKGDGTFQAPVDYTTGVGPVSAVIGDFNRDGHPDIAVANSGSQSLSIFLGNGDGTFQQNW